MLEWPASVQPLLIGGTLLWSGGLKFGRSARRTAEKSALPSLVGEARALTAYRLTGGVELALAAVLLLPPALLSESAGAAVLSLGFLAYLTYAKVAAPDSSCGCLGKRQTPVTWRGFARAGLLLAAALLGTRATGWWGGGIGHAPAAGLLIVEAALMIGFSPEADGVWLMPLRRMRIRMKHPLAERSFDMPLESSLQQLHASPAYRQVGALIKSGLLETWDEDDVRMLTYTADYEGTTATAVFAVPKRHYRPEDIRVALVDESTESTLLVLEGA